MKIKTTLPINDFLLHDQRAFKAFIKTHYFTNRNIFI